MPEPLRGLVVGSNEGPGGGSRFEGIDEALASNPGATVLSIDIFDTLLWRRVPKPTDAHLVLGRRLRDDGLLRSHVNPRLFARLRVLAEEEARARQFAARGTLEVTLLEIARILAPSISEQIDAPTLAERELANEQALTFPDVRLISSLRKQVGSGRRVVAVSDTYFGASQIASLFERHGIGDLGFDEIFTSSDAGTGKGAELWPFVIGKLGVEPAEIIHFGDNYDADVAAAGRAGVNGVHLPMSTDRFAGVVLREGIVGDTGEPSHWCDERAGDGGLTAARRRASLLPAPASVRSDQEHVSWETGAAVLGPVLSGFAQWVHAQAAALGASRALCLMREGRFLKRLLDGAAPTAGHGLTTSTVWASREGCARASIYEGTQEELRSFLERLNTPSPHQVLDSLGLDPADTLEIPRILDGFDRSEMSAAVAGRSLLDLVLRRGDLRQKVVDRSQERRSRLVAHIRAAAGQDGGPVLVVDVGWGATILESLQRMLRSEGADISLHGLYLLAHVGSAGPALRGTTFQGYLGDSGCIPFDLAGITGNPELVELACMCDEGTFLEMGADGRPVLAAPPDNPLQSSRRALLQDAVMAFQAEWLLHRTPDTPFESSSAARLALRRVLERLLSLPDEAEVEAFGWWEHEENFGSEKRDQLVPSQMRATLPYQAPEVLHHMPPNQLYWVGGAARVVDAETADAVFLMRRGQLGPGRLSSASGAGTAAIALVLADGSEVQAGESPTSRNRRGWSLLQWRHEIHSTPAAVRIRPARNRAIVRLDRVETSWADREGHIIGAQVWASDAEIDSLAVDGALRVGGRTYAIDGTSTIDVPVVPVPGARLLDVTVAAAYLAVPDIPRPDGSSYVDSPRELQELRRELRELHATKLFRATVAPRRAYGTLRRHIRRLAR